MPPGGVERVLSGRGLTVASAAAAAEADAVDAMLAMVATCGEEWECCGLKTPGEEAGVTPAVRWPEPGCGEEGEETDVTGRRLRRCGW